jgi:hemin uptake protein HemP
MNAHNDIFAMQVQPHRPPAAPRTALPVHDARSLTGATGQAQIVLDGQVYALRITRAGKLILTK